MFGKKARKRAVRLLETRIAEHESVRKEVLGDCTYKYVSIQVQKIHSILEPKRLRTSR